MASPCYTSTFALPVPGLDEDERTYSWTSALKPAPAMPDDNATPYTGSNPLETAPTMPDVVPACYNNILGTAPAMPDEVPVPYNPSLETDTAKPDDVSSPMEITMPISDNSWLDKFCMDLGYHNLTFLTTPYGCTGSVAGAAHFAGVDSTDGCIRTDGFKIIKTIVVALLQHLVDKKLKEICSGCEVNHPSQLRHSCIFEPNAYFFDFYFEELSRALFKPELKHIISQALSRCGLRIHPLRVQGSVDSILHELREEIFIVEKLSEIREKLGGPDNERIVRDAVDSWKGIIHID